MEEHKEYTTAIPAIQYNDLWIGITHLGFAKWDKSKNKVKNPKETPYTKEGREIRKKLTDKNLLVLGRMNYLVYTYQI